jgi:Protein of unknown function (DUF3455)
MTPGSRVLTWSIRAFACTALVGIGLVTGSASNAVNQSGVRRAHLGSGTLQAAYIHSTAGTATIVPPVLVPPAGQVLIADFAARGVQVYQCTAGAWVFLEPAANLLGSDVPPTSVKTAIHFRGPSWESTDDGSLVQGKVIASSPVTGSIPELLLQATLNRGTGIFGQVAYIQRLATSGGTAPAGACTDGQTSGVPYQAEYRFFAPAAG